MVDYLRTTNDEVTKTEVVKRIGELAERFAPDTQWFLDTMNQVCAAAVMHLDRQQPKQLHQQISSRTLCWSGHVIAIFLPSSNLSDSM